MKRQKKRYRQKEREQGHERGRKRGEVRLGKGEGGREGGGKQNITVVLRQMTASLMLQKFMRRGEVFCAGKNRKVKVLPDLCYI